MSYETLAVKGLYDIVQPHINSEQFMADKKVKELLVT
jgi:hypothetical protein